MPSSNWHLHSLSMTNMRMHEQLELQFDPELTVLVGLNGSGKTAILDAISIMMAPVISNITGKPNMANLSYSDARQVAHNIGSTEALPSMESAYPITLEATMSARGANVEWSRSLSSEGGRTSTRPRQIPGIQTFDSDNEEQDLPILAYYGVERLVGVHRNQGELGNSRLDAYESALDPKSDLARLNSYLGKLFLSSYSYHVHGAPLEQNPAGRQISAISSACDIALKQYGWSKPNWDPMLQEVTLTNTKSNLTLPLSWLSSGIRITAGLILDIASRMSRANSHMGTEEILRETTGIVLIDEIELHLHPRWQQGIVESLRKTFPNVQFIVTTHSPQVLSAVPAHSIRILSPTGVIIPRHSEGLGSETILRQLQETPPAACTEPRIQVEKYMDMVNSGQGRSPEAIRIRAAIDTEMGGIENVPELEEADSRIAFEAMIEEED